MFATPPDPIAFQLGPLAIGWYGLCYAIGLAAVYLVLIWLSKRAGEDPDVASTGIIVVAVAALIGGRLYHVIDEWELYADDPLSIILPPYSGLGVYGGIITGTIAAWWYARRRGAPFARWADIVAPSLFVMQAIGRWGNYFNQELYGPPTSAPWGIPIDCAHRLEVYACTVLPESTRFHPLFLYESISGILGAIALIAIGFRFRARLRPADLFLVFLIWYGTTRLLLETLREDNWLVAGVPVAQIISVVFIAVGIVTLIVRHRRGITGVASATFPWVQTWGAIGDPTLIPPRPADADDDDDDWDDDEDDDDDWDDDEEADEADETEAVAVEEAEATWEGEGGAVEPSPDLTDHR
jgi:phosphatidylglycerol:prolipoprotein diacylglycerol transferase